MLASLSRGFHKSISLLSSTDFYKILGLSKSASDTEVKKAYFDLAKRYHPDVNKLHNAKEKFSEINTAYETLGDREKRKIYDTTGLNADQQQEFNCDTDDFDDFFFEEEAPKKVKGEDVIVSVELSFLESVSGCEKTLSFEKLGVCTSCKGTRAKAGTKPLKCTTCSGYGVVLIQRGANNVQAACPKCNATGFIIKQFCVPCKGSGFAHQKCIEKVKIPAGVENNYTLKLGAKGCVSTSKGQTGDLNIKIRVKEHPILKRKGFDIFSTVSLHIGQAVLGGIAEIDTLHGKIEIKVEPGLKDCETVRLSNYGVQHLPPNSSSRGHQFVQFKVSIPRSLTAKQRQIFKELEKLESITN